jgi:hypothetical protein
VRRAAGPRNSPLDHYEPQTHPHLAVPRAAASRRRGARGPVGSLDARPALQPWHTHVPELSADALNAAEWTRYLAQEQSIIDDIRANVTQRLEPGARVAYNHYFQGSPVYPPRFAQD